MKNILFVTIVTLCLTSCGLTTPKYLFAPNTPNVLITEKKNDVKLAVNYSYTSNSLNNNEKLNSLGIDVQTAYGISKNLGVKMDVYSNNHGDESRDRINEIDNYKLSYKRKGVEASIGYRFVFGKKMGSNLSVHTGLGIGSNSFSGKYRGNAFANNYYKANHFKWFTTPALNLVCSKNYTIILGYRLSVLQFKNIQTNDKELRETYYYQLDNQNSVFGDFIFDNQFGFNKLRGIKFRVMSGRSMMLNFLSRTEKTSNSTSYYSGQYDYHNNFSALGVIVDVGTLFKK